MNFFVWLDKKPDTWEDHITLFVTYLIEEKKQSQTVKSYVSAIKGTLAEINVKINQDKFLLSALTRACKFKNDKARLWMPIRKGLLRIILTKTTDYYLQTLNQPYLCSLYRPLFSTAYFGLFRVGELTTATHPVRAGDVHIGQNKNKFLFTHGKYARPQSIKISSTSLSNNQNINKMSRMNADQEMFCPYAILWSYLQERLKFLNSTDSFFVFKDHTPVQPQHMRSSLKQILQLAGFDKDLFNCQSLRIGRASDLLRMGI